MKSLNNIIKELDEIEYSGTIEGQRYALLYEDIKVIQQKIKNERLSVSKGYEFALEQAEQRLLTFLQSTTTKSQEKHRRNQRANRLYSMLVGFPLLLFGLAVLFFKAGRYIERFGLETSSLFLLFGLATLILFATYTIILDKTIMSSLRILALLWLPLITWLTYERFLSESWLEMIILIVVVLTLTTLSLYPFAENILKRLSVGLGTIVCCLICTQTWELKDNIELFYFSMSLFLLPAFILMLTISFDYVFFLIPSASLAVGISFLFNGEISIGKGNAAIKISNIDNPATYWLTFLFFFIGWLSISYKAYLMFISSRDKSIHSDDLGNVIKKSQR